MDEKLISSSSEYDQVQIIFLQPYLLLNEQGLSLNAEKPLSSNIPPQLSAGAE